MQQGHETRRVTPELVADFLNEKATLKIAVISEINITLQR